MKDDNRKISMEIFQRK